MEDNSQYRSWCLLLVPCLLWSCLPPWQDVCLLSTFLITHVLFYTLRHVRGMLILSTLVLLLWTKSLFARWYRSKVLTREFFKSLLYLVMTATMSVAAVVVIWMPMYEGYACVVGKLDKGWAQVAMDWRNMAFLLLAMALASSALAHTDLVLKPNQVDNAGLMRVMNILCRLTCRAIRSGHRQFKAILQAVDRSLRLICGDMSGETRAPMAFCRASAAGGDLPEETLQPASDGSGITDQQEDHSAMEGQGENVMSGLTTARMAPRRTDGKTPAKRWGTAKLPCCNVSPSSSTRRLRSCNSPVSGDSASDLQPGADWAPTGTGASARPQNNAARRAGLAVGAKYRKNRRGSCVRFPRMQEASADTPHVANRNQKRQWRSSAGTAALMSVDKPSNAKSVTFSEEDVSVTSLQTSLSEKLVSCVLPESSSAVSNAPSAKSTELSLSRMLGLSRGPREDTTAELMFREPPRVSRSQHGSPSKHLQHRVRSRPSSYSMNQSTASSSATSLQASLSQRLWSCIVPGQSSSDSIDAASTESLQISLSRMLGRSRFLASSTKQRQQQQQEAPSAQSSLQAPLTDRLRACVMPERGSPSSSQSSPAVSLTSSASDSHLSSVHRRPWLRPRARRQADPSRSESGSVRDDTEEGRGSRHAGDHNQRVKSPSTEQLCDLS
ncbi:hypothetical protein ACOMHN_063652 [Nucella lapillus]